MWWHVPVISQVKGSWSGPTQAKPTRPYLQKTKAQKAGSMDQVAAQDSKSLQETHHQAGEHFHKIWELAVVITEVSLGSREVSHTEFHSIHEP
jgi:hypothetical protein